MLSDRIWFLKVAAALGVFAWLCNRSERDFARTTAEVEHAAIPLETLRGKTVYFWARQVRSVHPDGFEIETKVGPCRVLSSAPFPSPGDHVSARGVIAGHRLVEAHRVQINEGYRWKRGLNYALSAATLLLFLWLIRKRFRWRLREGLLAGRY